MSKKTVTNKRLCLIIVIILNLGILFFFKYFNFFIIIIENIILAMDTGVFSWNAMLTLKGTGSLGIKDIALPIGIRTYINLFVVFLLTGVWHGANFTFIVWGLIYAFLLIIERLFLGKLLAKNPLKPLNWLYTIMSVMIGWIFFRSDNILQAREYIKQLFMPATQTYTILSYLSMKVIVCIVVGVLCSGFIQRVFSNIYEKYRTNFVIVHIDYIIQIVLLILSIFSIVSGTYNPFIYFQF